MTSRELSIKGARATGVKAGLRYRGRLDVALFELNPGTVASGVFTRNQFKAAPVVIAERHLKQCAPRYLLINSAYANAGLGAQGDEDAMRCCEALAQQAGVNVSEVMPFSTGVIGERIPVEKIIRCIPDLLNGLSESSWADAAEAIMTTDAFAKIESSEVDCSPLGKVSITGIAKGAGMICPNMATMLAFVGTDIRATQTELDELLSNSCADSFNRITVDGDTSTNDACMLFATGHCGVSFEQLDESGKQRFTDALKDVMRSLAEKIVRDGEGARHLIRISVEQSVDEAAAKKVAYAVAHSPLVKTAMAAADPNWGRVLAAVGRAGADIDINRIELYFGDVCVFKNGALHSKYEEKDGLEALSKSDINIRIVLNSGTQSAVVFASDLTEEYVRINASYRS